MSNSLNKMQQDAYMISQAMRLANEIHMNQLDRGGNPYILHPITVMMKQTTDNAKIVALLHDTIEDFSETNYCGTLEEYHVELLELFPIVVVNATTLLTRDFDQHLGYMDYIKAISENPLATAVKLADLEHNMDITRLSNLNNTNLERLQRYHDAYKFLKGVVK